MNKYKVGQVLVRARLGMDQAYDAFEIWDGYEMLGKGKVKLEPKLGNRFWTGKIIGSKTHGQDFFLYDESVNQTVLLGYFVLDDWFTIKMTPYRKLWVSCSK